MKKFRFMLFAGCILLFSGLANAQFNAILYYVCDPIPLTINCDGTGGPIPDGASVEIFWDADDDGPDADDQQPVVGNGFAECNFNTFAMNGLELFGCEGGFGTDPAFTISTNTPQPSRYWLRICVPGQARHWRTNSFTIADGLADYDFDGLFICVEEACGGCLTPPGVSGLTASSNSCANVTLNWNPYPAEPDVNTLRIRRDGVRIAVVPRTQTSFIDSNAPAGTSNYELIAARDCGPGDTAVAAAAVAFGTRIPIPVAPHDSSVVVSATPGVCSSINIRWRTPQSTATFDSFGVFQNDIVIRRVGPGTAGNPVTHTILTPLSGPQNYSIKGWSEECGYGPPTSNFPGTAFQQPAQVSGVTATQDSCNSTRISWTAVPLATSYIVRRNGTQIGTTVVPGVSFFDNSGSIGVTFQYTVAAVISTNPAACQEGAQSASANGSRISTPTAPTSVLASDSTICSHVLVTWTDNSTNETGFIIRRGGTNIDTVGAGVTSYNDSSGATAPATSSYQIAALNACGASAFATANVGSKKPLPPQVTGLTATNNLSDRVTLNWTNVIRETGYRIHRDAVLLVVLDSVGANVTTYNDFTATPNTSYNYTVEAFNECGNGPMSAAATGQVLASLNAPTNVVASDTLCTHVRVTWTDNNSNPNETGHEVVRNGSVIATLGADVTAYDDNSAVAGTTYSYLVRALGVGGPAASQPDSGRRVPVPAVVTIFAGESVNCDDVILAWTDPVGADSIKIYRDGVVIDTVATGIQTYTDNVGNGPQSFDYYLVACNECGASASSDTITVDVLQSPTVPENVQASDTSCSEVLVTWDASSGDVDEYHVYRDGAFAASVGGATLSYHDDPGDTDEHTYNVAATSATCADSDTSSGTTGRQLEQVGTPVIYAMPDRCDSISFCWTPASGDVDGYYIYEDQTLIDSTSDTCYAYVPTEFGAFAYTVSAYSVACGEGVLSVEAVGGYLASPVAPANFVGSDDRCDVVVLTWDAQPENTAAVIYHVYRGATQIGGDIAGTSFVDSNAVLGVNNYTIYAIPSEEGCDSSEASVTTGTILPLPTAPTNVVASDTSCSDVYVTWTVSTGEFDGYIVYRDGDSIAFVTAPITEFTDTGIAGGATAAYTVKAYDDVCGISDPSTADDGTRLQGPNAPANVTASTTNCDTIFVGWNTSAGDVTEYRVFRNGVQVGTVPAPDTTFSDTPAAGSYTYRVRAFSEFCGETSPSDSTVGTRLPQMGQVTGVTASVDSCEGVLISWTEFPGAVRYTVYRDGDSLMSVNAPATSFFDFGVVMGESRSYTVSAVNPCNEGAQSAAAVGQRAETPGQVTGLTATQNLVNEVCLSWEDVDGELGFFVYRNGSLIATNSADDTSYCDQTAVPGTEYSYTIAAYNVCGEGDESAAALGLAVFSLNQVTGLVATTTDCNQICLTWTDIANETGYEILRDGVVIDSVGADVVSYCDVTPAAGECFSYSVRGYNEGGSGSLSDAADGCRRAVPGAVDDLFATTTACDVVTLSWEDIGNEEGYQVWRSGTMIATIATGSVQYIDNTATPGVLYNYWLVAVNACGSGPVSNTAPGAIATVPGQVTNVTATNNICARIDLTWTDLLLETGYAIYRDGNLVTPIATVGANVTSYSDVGAIGAHTYQVRGSNACGNGPVSAVANGLGFTVPGLASGVTASENCGTVTVMWTAPATTPITEYKVLRNGTQIATVPAGTTTYVNSNVPAGTYTYRIITSNQCGDGAQSVASNSVTVIPALVQVTGFTAVASPCFCIDLSWGNVANEDGYYIYCNGVIVDTVGANVTSSEFCPADTSTCLMQVAAFNGCEIGPLSTGVSVTPFTYPVAVTGFAASENVCDRVVLNWNGYNQPGVMHLKIRRNGVALMTVPSSNTSFTHLGIWPVSTYSITALRVCAAGDTIESAIASDPGRTAPTPVAPSQMAASDDGCGIVTVSFTFNNVDGQDSVYIKRNGIILARLAGGIVNAQRTYVDANPLPQAANYDVCPKSNLCGEGACGSDVGTAAPTAGTVTNLAATNDRCTSIILTWTGTQHALNYQIRRNGNLLATVPQGQFTYTDNVATGVVFSYTVAATNACGSGPQTPSVQGSTIPLPPMPTGFSASDGLCNVVVVTWNEIPVATEYQVWKNNVLLATVPAGLEFYNDPNVLPGVVYQYQVRGVNQCGLGLLSPVNAGNSAQPVPIVANVVASTDLDDRVRVTWNNVNGETGFEILRGFPAVVIATVAANITSYNDFSAAPGVEYEYRVRAYNDCGGGELSVVAYGYRVPVNPIPFGVITVTTDLYGCMSAEVVDVDDDGDADVVACGMFADKVMWYENTGTWDYVPHVIAENWDGARSITVGDIDDDGDIDIAAVAQFADQLVWFRQNANGTFTQFVIASNYDGARDVLIVDLDGDGDEDLVTAACDANDVSWWRNNGSETFTRFVIDNNFTGARSIEVADIGNDGDWDILGAAYEGGMLAWWSNNGSEAFTRTVLMSGVFGASYINAAHLNNDNVLDIYFCVAQQPLVGWWDGATNQQNYVTSLIPFPREMDAVDMDEDGRADLLLAANENQEISWWRNTDNRFYRNVITSTMWQASVVHGSDFDNDGDTDVIGAGEGTIKLWLSTLADDRFASELLLPPGNDDDRDKPAFGQPVVPVNYELADNYPNPFNPMTQIRFGLPEAQTVQLTVYDVTGREVTRLVDGTFGAGYHTVTFDASAMASGVYLYRIVAGEFVASRKMILMK